MAIGQSNMFSAPGSQQLGGNQQLANVSQPTAPSIGAFDTTAPVGQTMNQMGQSQMQTPLFGGGIGSLAPPMMPPNIGLAPPMMPPNIGYGPPPTWSPGFRPPGGGFPPPSIGLPPGGIGGLPRPPMMPPGRGYGPPPTWSPGFRPPGIGGSEIPPFLRDRIAGIGGGGLGGLDSGRISPVNSLIGNVPVFGNTPMPPITDEVG